MKLTKKILHLLSDSSALQGKIADATGRSFTTVQRWIDRNDTMLTTASVLQIIREETGFKDEVILEEAVA